jgi:hypothetical protein
MGGIVQVFLEMQDILSIDEVVQVQDEKILKCKLSHLSNDLGEQQMKD